MTINQLLMYQNRSINNHKKKGEYYKFWSDDFYKLFKDSIEKASSDVLSVRKFKTTLKVEGRFGGVGEKIEFSIKRIQIPTKSHWKEFGVGSINFKNENEKNLLGGISISGFVAHVEKRRKKIKDARDSIRNQHIDNLNNRLKNLNITFKDYKSIEKLVNKIDNGFYEGEKSKW